MITIYCLSAILNMVKARKRKVYIPENLRIFLLKVCLMVVGMVVLFPVVKVWIILNQEPDPTKVKRSVWTVLNMKQLRVAEVISVFSMPGM